MTASKPIILSAFHAGLLHNTVAGSDCDCACPVDLAVPAAPALPDAPLQLRPEVRWLPLDETFSLAFAPSLSQVAAVNGAARGMLERFVTPRRWRTSEERQVAQDGFALGLLTAHDAEPAPPPPNALVAWLHVTNACNLRCGYCYIEKSDEAMDLETGMAAVDAALRSAIVAGYRRLELKYAGGEASLNMALVEQLHPYAVAQAAARGITVGGRVLSNGVALTSPRLKQMRALGLELMISLDGVGADHDRQRPTLGGGGSFARVVATIDRAIALDLLPQISVTISVESVGGLPQLLELLLDRELPFSLSFVRPANFDAIAVHHAEQSIIAGMRAAYAAIERRPPRRSLLGSLLDRTNLSTAHRRTCGVGENYMVFDQRGNIAKCQMTINQPVSSVTHPDPLSVIRADQIGVRNLPVEQKAGCRTCDWRYWCAGGCGVVTKQSYGQEDVASPNCAIYKALYPDVLRLEGLRLVHWWRRQQSVG